LKAAAKRVAAKAPKPRKPAPQFLAGGKPSDREGRRRRPVQAYIAAMPGWKRDVGRRLDALIVRTVPGVRKAVKWNSPLYRVEGQGWFLGIHTFTDYVKVAFFRGSSLRPPGESKSKDTRYLDIHEDDQLDEAQLAGFRMKRRLFSSYYRRKNRNPGCTAPGRRSRVRRCAGLTASRSPWIKEALDPGPSSAQKVLSERRSSRSGREQLPVLRQNYLIDCMNDAVRRDEIGLRDADSINPHV
jgi:hypothetical protein